MTPPCIEPDWPAPRGIRAFATTRRGGVSEPPFASFNLGHHVGDSPAAVAANRARLGDLLPPDAAIQWLQQVHGTAVIEAGGEVTPEADACWSARPGVACAVMTADCLPLLFCDSRGQVVAAAHAGWRGLLAGVVEATIAAMPVEPGRIMAWLGPAIGPDCFEVGGEVREQFLAVDGARAAARFSENPDNPGHFLADIYQLARQRLANAGVTAVYGGGHCTFTDRERFFSYRRDGQTGRMASLVVIDP